MRFTAILLLSFLVGQSIKSQTFFRGDLKQGSYTIGFKTLTLTDSSRLYGNEIRPILISMWYPASAKNNRPVYFRDHLFITERKAKLNRQTASEENTVLDNFTKRLAGRVAKSEEISQLLLAETGSYWNATLSPRNYPLILTLQGGGRPAYTQFILNQYLASHGYLVVAIADIRSDPDRKKTTTESNIRSLSADMSSIMQFFKASKEFQVNQTGVIGFSKAGEAILQNQLNHHAFQSIVTMDAQPEGEALALLSQQDLSSINAPLLAFFSNHQGNLSYEEASQDSLAFDFLPNSQGHKIRLMESNHGELTSAAILGKLVSGYNRWPSFGNAQLSYETLCRLTLAFFDLHLKGETDKQQVLDDPIRALGLSPKFLIKH